MNHYYHKVILLLQTHLKLTLRTKVSLLSALFFSLLVIIVLNISLTLNPEQVIKIAPNVIWLATLFGSTLMLGQSYDHEKFNQVMLGIRLVPQSAHAFFTSKLIVHFVLIVWIELSTTLFTTLFFNYPLHTYWAHIALPLILGALGIAAVGTTFASMLVSNQKRDLILPIIFYPIIMPLVVAVVQSMGYTEFGSDSTILTPWLRIIIAFDIVYVTASLLVFNSLTQD